MMPPPAAAPATTHHTYHSCCQFADPILRSKNSQYSGWCKYSNTFPCERAGATGFTKIGQDPDPCEVSCAFESNPTTCRQGPSGGPLAFMPDGAVCAPATAPGGFGTCQNNVCTSAVDPKLNAGGGGGPGQSCGAAAAGTCSGGAVTDDTGTCATNPCTSNDFGGTSKPCCKAAPPAISISLPNAGSTWTAGGTGSVAYTTTASIPANTPVTFTLKRAPSLTEVGETLTSTNTGSYAFAVPASPDHGGDWGNQYQLCATTSGVGTAASKCSATFEMQPQPAIDSVTLSPASTVYLGADLNIGWTFTGTVSNVKIDLLRNGAVDRQISASVYASAKSFKWTVPVSGLTVGNGVFKVRVQSRTDAAVSAKSAGIFSITAPPSLSVLVPTVSSTWTRDATAQIVFSSSGINGQAVSVQVYDSKMPTNTEYEIQASLAATGGSQSVPVTKAQTKAMAAGTGYRVVVRDTATGALFAESGQFQVAEIGVVPTGTLAVGAPSTCIAGNDCTPITFTAAQFSPTRVKISYSGTSAGTIVADLAMAGASPFTWSVPKAFPAGNYRITVQALDGGTPLVSGVSTNTLTVVPAASVVVSTPLAGAAWSVGITTATVTWEGVNLLGNDARLDSVDILLIDVATGATVGAPLATAYSGGSSMGGTKGSLAVPAASVFPGGAPKAGNAYKVRVRSAAEPTFFADSGAFAIVDAATITLRSPTGGSVWSPRSTCPISFSVDGFVPQVKIELVRIMSGAGVAPVRTSVVQVLATPWASAPGLNAFRAFDIPESTAAGSKYAIVVTSLSDNGVSSGPKESDAFTIVTKPYLDILNPILGASLSVGKNNVIQWRPPAAGTLGGAGDRVDIDIVRSRAGAASLYSVGASVAASGANKLWYASSNEKGALAEGGANYAVRIKDSSSAAVNKLYALIRTYPGAARVGMRAGSFVEISPSSGGVQLRYHFNFANDPATLQPGAGLRGGMHVHTGTTCAVANDIGGHFFKDGAQDPWNDVQWTLFDGTNTAQAAGLSGLAVPALTDMDGRAFVVHASDGRRVGCGVLRSFVHGESAPFSFEARPSLTVMNVDGLDGVTPGSVLYLSWTTVGHVAKVRLGTCARGRGRDFCRWSLKLLLICFCRCRCHRFPE